MDLFKITRCCLLPLFLVFALSSCKDLLTQHNINLKGVLHGKKLYSGAKNCTACHGVNLNGNGPIPSCNDCHGNLWASDDHTSKRGNAWHKPGASAKFCRGCHGSDLKGSYSRPGCYDCHDNVWADLQTRHTVNLNGVYHGQDRNTPNRSCAGCHGSNLTGDGYAPSCYSCHRAKWINTSDHDVMIYGVGHAEQYNDPQNNCTDCHGSDLRGTRDAPSCYSCHGQKWSDSDGGNEGEGDDKTALPLNGW